jgi:LAS superfamily LD-carboxypeptidase LdcB
MEQIETKPKKNILKWVPQIGIGLIIIILAVFGTAWYTSDEQQIHRFDAKIAQVQAKYDKSIQANIKCDYNEVTNLYDLNLIKQEKYKKFGTHNHTEVIHYEKLQNDLPEIETWKNNIEQKLNETGTIPVVKASEIVADYDLVITGTEVYIVRKGSTGTLQDEERIRRNAEEVAKLSPEMQGDVDIFLKRAEVAGIQLLVTDGYRIADQQEYLYSLGRTREGNIVTNISTCDETSKHCIGKAIDVVAVIDGKIDYNNTDWEKLKELTTDFNWTWGGDWETFIDRPHFEIGSAEVAVTNLHPETDWVGDYEFAEKQITKHILNIKPNSPVVPYIHTGIEEYKKLKLDPYIGFAIMQKESSYGLAGRAVWTENPCNVGNTAKYSNDTDSWEAGVKLCANNLWRRKNGGMCVTDIRSINASLDCSGNKVTCTRSDEMICGLYADPSGRLPLEQDTWTSGVTSIVSTMRAIE